MLTGMSYLGQVAGGWYVLNRVQTSVAVGGLIGSSITLTFLSLMTAIYWGQLSGCAPEFDHVVDEYSCVNVSAYKAVCAFAVLIFIAEGAFCAILISYKHDFASDGHAQGTADRRAQTTNKYPFLFDGNFKSGYGNLGRDSTNPDVYAAGSFMPMPRDSEFAYDASTPPHEQTVPTTADL